MYSNVFDAGKCITYEGKWEGVGPYEMASSC